MSLQERQVLLHPRVERDTHSRFPWSGRSRYEWVKSITAEEAARLFFLARAHDEKTFSQTPDFSDPSFLISWDLEEALQAYGVEQLQAQKIEFGQYKDLGSSLETVFEDTRMYPFLLSLRDIFKEESSAEQEGESWTFEAARRLGYSNEVLEELLPSYHHLLGMFFSPLRYRVNDPYYRFKFQDIHDREDEVQKRLAEAVVRFYWEPSAIDPLWVANRFLQTAAKATRGGTNGYVDAQRLALTPSYPVIEKTSAKREDPAEMAVANLVLEQVFEKARAEASPEAIVVFELRVLGDQPYEYIAEALGISKNQAMQLAKDVREKMRPELERFYPEHAGEKSSMVSKEWKELKTSPEKYRKHLPELDSHFQGILQAALDHATGERKSTVDAVRKLPRFRGLKFASVCRNILRAIHITQHTDTHPSGNATSKKWVRDQEGKEFRNLRDANPSLWHSFSQRQRRIAELVIDGYINRAIGTELDVHESTVSRELENIRIAARNFPRV